MQGPDFDPVTIRLLKPGTIRRKTRRVDFQKKSVVFPEPRA